MNPIFAIKSFTKNYLLKLYFLSTDLTLNLGNKTWELLLSKLLDTYSSRSFFLFVAPITIIPVCGENLKSKK